MSVKDGANAARSGVRWISWLPKLSMLLCVVGCSPPQVEMAEGPREYVAGDYEAVLRLWTRAEQLTSINELDNVLTVTATYESWDFRWAYVVRYAEDYRLTVDQRRTLLERSLAESHERHEFYVALYAQRYKWNNLNLEEPAWIIRLIDDTGTETAPSEIQAIKKPGAIELTYFPYTSPWRSAYRISFPRVRADGRPTIPDDARWFGLRFAGAQGNQTLAWQIAEPPVPVEGLDEE
jgi:hypothetical protein